MAVVGPVLVVAICVAALLVANHMKNKLDVNRPCWCGQAKSTIDLAGKLNKGLPKRGARRNARSAFHFCPSYSKGEEEINAIRKIYDVPVQPMISQISITQ